MVSNNYRRCVIRVCLPCHGTAVRHVPVVLTYACCRKQLQLDAGLEQLRRFFAWIFLITGTLNLVVMIVMRSMLSNYGGLLSDMQLFGQRQVLLQVCDAL